MNGVVIFFNLTYNQINMKFEEENFGASIEMIQQDHANQELLEVALERQAMASNLITRFIARLVVARIESRL